MDGEGCFIIRPNYDQGKQFNFSFLFKIQLHKDDRPVLEYLSERLKIGHVYPKPSSNSQSNICSLQVKKMADLLKLIEIFDNHSLNTSKYLDYLAWRKAIFLYFGMKEASETIKTTIMENILSLKNEMNNSRISFVLPANHKVNITPYWLLGFTEGVACFQVEKASFILKFSLGQTIVEKAVIKEIAKFLHNLIPESLNLPVRRNNAQPNIIKIYERPAIKA